MKSRPATKSKHYKDSISKAERYALGESIRKECPIESHSGFNLREETDVAELHVQNTQDRIRKLLPIRYERLMESPFAFYRGNAALMASHLVQMPSSKLYLQACGDCHLLNFGGFATPERKIVFDINDFDETAVAPWEWDLKRLVASFAIAGDCKGFSTRECHDAAWTVANSYRKHMDEFADMSALQIWYAQISIVDIIKSGKIKDARQFDPKAIKRAITAEPHERELAKFTFEKNGNPRIKDTPPLVFHVTPEKEHAFFSQAEKAYDRYVKTLPLDRRTLLQLYNIRDVAMKVVGVGSVGTRCGIMLLMSATGDPLFLQFKEARQSVLERYLGKGKFAHNGQRVVEGQKLIQSASDIFLGWTADDAGKQFYIRQLRDAKIKPALESMDYHTFLSYACSCGWALARAHARTGDPAILSGYMGGTEEVEEAMALFAIAYAKQNEEDYQKLQSVLQEKKLAI
ncbi:DUF2252 domain-containing protein [Sphingobacterium siyangense]|uniref:DUF2252 domain-containing protein n=1 Tax=Sphingobacterium siyangense TaxID=459529 RepID=UPI0019645464|nr:DUF2252 domain-containing protein [Sphingobacterium siyangense]QRY55466.1 DUF2252 domain-containing protein [Sphingobacterium siyangense]